jgi:hypothetical protein
VSAVLLDLEMNLLLKPRAEGLILRNFEQNLAPAVSIH